MEFSMNALKIKKVDKIKMFYIYGVIAHAIDTNDCMVYSPL